MRRNSNIEDFNNNNNNLNLIQTNSNDNRNNGENPDSINEFSNFNLNMYSDLSGNNLENNNVLEDNFIRTNFESNLDDIFYNLTYLISTEKYFNLIIFF